jgi:hypothetical protein
MTMTELYKKTIGRFFARRQAATDILRDPARDWMRLVILFLVLFAGVIAGHLVFFYKLNRGDFNRATEAAKNPINKNFLEQTIESYSTREKKFNEYKLVKPEMIDPSL